MTRGADVIVRDACAVISAAVQEIERHTAVYDLAPIAFILHALAELRKARDNSALAIRFLIEQGADLGIQKRALAAAAGVNVGSVTRWQELVSTPNEQGPLHRRPNRLSRWYNG